MVQVQHGRNAMHWRISAIILNRGRGKSLGENHKIQEIKEAGEYKNRCDSAPSSSFCAGLMHGDWWHDVITQTQSHKSIYENKKICRTGLLSVAGNSQDETNAHGPASPERPPGRWRQHYINTTGHQLSHARWTRHAVKNRVHWPPVKGTKYTLPTIKILYNKTMGDGVRYRQSAMSFIHTGYRIQVSSSVAGCR